MTDLAVEEDFRATEMSWLAEHRDELAQRFRGEWIAVDGCEVVAHNDNLARLIELAREAGHTDPFITAIPTETLARFYA